jgi:hypothetical protein
MLGERAVELGRAATFDDLSDGYLDALAGKGFEWVWLLGVWQTGQAAREIARADAQLREAFRRALPDLREEDIFGSPFAILAYRVHADFGGDAALARLRARMAGRGLALLLDFVPNHTGIDHPWAAQHPEYYVTGSERDLAREPQNYLRMGAGAGQTILAHGRDPYFDGWRDTLQLNYRHAGLRQAQRDQLAAIAARCDGVRCDMAMLLQPEVLRRTWGDRSLPADGSPPLDAPFWPEAIAAVRRVHPTFLFIAEVYWDMEPELQRAGFDYTYDKGLYDRLRAETAGPVRQHLMAAADLQDRCVRFLENHDEPRAALVFRPPVHRAAALLTFFARGMRFFHEGELEGRRVHSPIQLGRRPGEPIDRALQDFYGRLLEALKRPEARDGQWRLHDARQAWSGNPTHQQFIIWSCTLGQRRLLGAVNYGGSQGQGYVTLDGPGFGEMIGLFDLVDRLGVARYRRRAEDLRGGGLYLDLPAWGHHLFELRPA